MQFRIIEDDRRFNLENLLQVFRNESPVYVIRNMIDPTACKKIKDEFQQMIRESNGGNRSDVPVHQVGATQYSKQPQEYFEECIQTRDDVQRIERAVEAASDFLLEELLKKEFSTINVSFRPSRYADQQVNLFAIRQWLNVKDNSLALLPHEDLSQVCLAEEKGYEIAKVKRVVACNLCVFNSGGGELVIWNYEPNMELKKSLGVEYSGYPYPMDILSGSESLSIEVNAGDIYFINANLIHAVKEVKGNERISAGRFMGFIVDDTVVYWT